MVDKPCDKMPSESPSGQLGALPGSGAAVVFIFTSNIWINNKENVKCMKYQDNAANSTQYVSHH